MKMNKGFALLMLLVLMLMVMLPSCAEEINLPAMEEKNVMDTRSLDTFIRKTDQTDRSVFETEDVVVLHEDGSVEVTAQGVTLSILPPFGWTILTQDVLAQLDVYLSLTDDVEGLVAEMKSNNAHAYAIDTLAYGYGMFCLEQDTFSKLFGNMAEIPENRYQSVMSALKNAYGAEQISIVELGNNRFFKMEGFGGAARGLIYTTYVNDRTLDIYCFPGEEILTDYEMETYDLMMTDLVVTAE